MHLISPARSMPFGSERSHFAHSPHLLAALILLIPPEIRGELKRKARSKGGGPLLWRAVPRGRAAPGLYRDLASGGRRWETRRASSRGMGGFYIFSRCGQFRKRKPGQAHPAWVWGPQPGLGLRWARQGSGGRGARSQRPDARWASGWGGRSGPAAPGRPAARVPEQHPTTARAPRPALTRCNSPAHFSPRDSPSVNSSLT